MPESILRYAVALTYATLKAFLTSPYGLFKNAFRRLPRRAFGTARNDEFPTREVFSGSLKIKLSPKPFFQNCHSG
ncbi:MAG: hypothetical protein IJV35_07590 [Neisseriaceae bacterium]|nr:hypothetical protein [Neisseriaceae bacterium]